MQGLNSERIGAAFVRWAGIMRSPATAAVLPAALLGSYWIGGETGLVAGTVVASLALAASGLAGLRAPVPPGTGRDRQRTGRTAFLSALDQALVWAEAEGRGTGCIVLRLDDAEELRARHGASGWDMLLDRCAERLLGALRESDTLGRIEGGRFAIGLSATRKVDLETLIQIASRLQEVILAPIALDGLTVYVTASAGFCLPERAPAPGPEGLLGAAERALEAATRAGPGALRAYGPELAQGAAGDRRRSDELARALETGQIVAFFQPQISTDTGAVTGFEALARWQHPERGLIPPSEFLPRILAEGLTERLGDVMRGEALRALTGWERAGFVVPSVCVNFSTAELREPRLSDRIAWELDSAGLRPERLTVEVLESVIAEGEDDVIVQNLARLARLGCGIDLDDFGTGHAAIANIRRFHVRRLKIDRSFVANVDQDRDQQAIVAGILSLAERLGLATVGEGVETQGEHALLAQLGCSAVQGFAIARPMPFPDTLAWLAQRREAQPTSRALKRRLT